MKFDKLPYNWDYFNTPVGCVIYLESADSDTYDSDAITRASTSQLILGWWLTKDRLWSSEPQEART